MSSGGVSASVAGLHATKTAVVDAGAAAEAPANVGAIAPAPPSRVGPASGPGPGPPSSEPATHVLPARAVPGPQDTSLLDPPLHDSPSAPEPIVASAHVSARPDRIA